MAETKVILTKTVSIWGGEGGPFSRKGLPPLPNLHIFTEHAPPPPGETGKCGRAVRCAIPGWNRCTGSRP